MAEKNDEHKKNSHGSLDTAKTYVESDEPRRLLEEKNSHIELDNAVRKNGMTMLLVSFVACRLLVAGLSVESVTDPQSLAILAVLMSVVFLFSRASGSRGSYEYHMNELASGETYAFLKNIPEGEI